MNSDVSLLNPVAVIKDIPEEGLRRGQVGTVVEVLAPDVFEVEFLDDDSYTQAIVTLHTYQIMLLHHALMKAG